MSESKYRASVDKALKAFPEYARDLIDWLIQDRADATNNEKYMRQWSIAAVRPREKHAYREGKKLVKAVKGSDWLIMIKGETVGKVERRRPDRWEDPWRKSSPRRRGRYPRHYARYDDREDERPRPHYEQHGDYPRPPAMPSYERVVVEKDPLDSGFLNVGLFSNQEDAEARMDRVLDDMAGMTTATTA
jgi:hypothetical protein